MMISCRSSFHRGDKWLGILQTSPKVNSVGFRRNLSRIPWCSISTKYGSFLSWWISPKSVMVLEEKYFAAICHEFQGVVFRRNMAAFLSCWISPKSVMILEEKYFAEICHEFQGVVFRRNMAAFCLRGFRRNLTCFLSCSISTKSVASNVLSN